MLTRRLTSVLQLIKTVLGARGGGSSDGRIGRGLLRNYVQVDGLIGGGSGVMGSGSCVAYGPGGGGGILDGGPAYEQHQGASMPAPPAALGRHSSPEVWGRGMSTYLPTYRRFRTLSHLTLSTADSVPFHLAPIKLITPDTYHTPQDTWLKKDRMELLRSVMKYGLPIQPCDVAAAAARAAAAAAEGTPPAHLIPPGRSDAAAAAAAATCSSFCEATRRRCPILVLKSDVSMLRALADLVAEMGAARKQPGQRTFLRGWAEWDGIEWGGADGKME